MFCFQLAGGPILLRYSAKNSLPSIATGGIIVFATGELAQGAGVRAVHSAPCLPLWDWTQL